MKLEKKVERGVKQILIGDTDLSVTGQLSAYMAATNNYECDGPIRRSQVTGEWFQWWNKAEAVNRGKPQNAFRTHKRRLDNRTRNDSARSNPAVVYLKSIACGNGPVKP